MSAFAVARKDFADAIQSWLLLGVSAVFVVFAAGAAYVYLALDAVGGNATSSLSVVAFLSGVSSFFVPVLGLIVGYGAIARECESGSIALLLSLPHTRRDVVFGKVLGRTGVVSVAAVCGFALAAGVILTLSGSLSFVAYVLFAAATVGLALAFVSLAVGFSAAARSSNLALAGAGHSRCCRSSRSSGTSSRCSSDTSSTGTLRSRWTSRRPPRGCTSSSGSTRRRRTRTSSAYWSPTSLARAAPPIRRSTSIPASGSWCWRRGSSPRWRSVIDASLRPTSDGTHTHDDRLASPDDRSRDPPPVRTMSLVTLLTDPDATLQNRAENPTLLKPLVIVFLAAIAAVLSPLLTYRAFVDAGAPPLASFTLGASVVFAFFDQFVAWIGLAIVFFVLSVAVGGEGSLGDTLKLNGYGFLPAVLAGVVGAIGQYLALQQVPVPDLPAKFNKDTAAQFVHALSQFQTAIQHQPAVRIATLVAILLTVWQAVIWFYATKHARDLSVRGALIGVGLPVALLVLANLWGLLNGWVF